MHFEVWWLLAFIFWMTVIVGIYRLTLAFLTRKSDRALPEELERRLARIEHATESTAIEVERIGESQRYLTRVVSERLGAGQQKAAPERVITPH